MSGKFALIIGNTEYVDPGLAQLTSPGKDVEDFVRVLKSQEICAFDDIKVLLNQPEHIIRRGIDVFFDQKKPDDLLVLYFSGHGIRDELGTLYLAVKNTMRNRLRSTAINSEYVRDVMDQSRSKRQVLILDCCNSGAVAQGTKAATGVSVGTVAAFDVGYGRIILTASDSTQFAWEGDKVIGETDNSLFTHFLVKGLEGEADLDGDGHITVDELYDYAYDKVRLATPKQTPSKFSSKQQGEIILRQNIPVGDIKQIPLPADLIEEIEDTRPYVREAAVKKLEKIIKGKNIGLVLSAKEALAKIVADENTTRRVAETATQVLNSINQPEQKEGERKESNATGNKNTTKEEAQYVSIEKVGLAGLTQKEHIGKQVNHQKTNAKKSIKNRSEGEPAKFSMVLIVVLGGIGIILTVFGYVTIKYLSPISFSATQTPVAESTVPTMTVISSATTTSITVTNTPSVTQTIAPTFMSTLTPTLATSATLELSTPEQIFFDPFTTHLGDEPLLGWHTLSTHKCGEEFFGEPYFGYEATFEINLPISSVILGIEYDDTDASNPIVINDQVVAYIPNQNIYKNREWKFTLYRVSIPISSIGQGINSLRICPELADLPDYEGDRDDFEIQNVVLEIER